MSKNLNKIVDEIESFSKMYKESNNKELKESYNRYIEIVISEAEVAQQYNLCDYWARLIRD